MLHKNETIITLLIMLVFAFLSVSIVYANNSVGVKKGDWIEYQVSTTGSPEEGHDVVWARMEILNVEGSEISVNVTTKAHNNTYYSDIMNLNPTEGRVGVWFIIPPNLNVGDVFYDATEKQTVTIEGSQQRTIAGATRTITHTTIPERIKSWDQATGVFVESIDTLPDYNLTATAQKTNMWSPQILGINPLYFYIIAILAIVAIAILTWIALIRRKTTQ